MGLHRKAEQACGRQHARHRRAYRREIGQIREHVGRDDEVGALAGFRQEVEEIALARSAVEILARAAASIPADSRPAPAFRHVAEGLAGEPVRNRESTCGRTAAMAMSPFEAAATAPVPIGQAVDEAWSKRSRYVEQSLHIGRRMADAGTPRRARRSVAPMAVGGSCRRASRKELSACAL